MSKLSIKSFEKAKQYLLNSGSKYLYLECKRLLEELKKLNNDFEYIITKLTLDIAKQFLESQNYITGNLKKSNDIEEKDVRDYFKSHINIVKNEIAVAESVRTIGYSDIVVSGKDFSSYNPKAIFELKVWGRNDYKNIANQLKSYFTDFEKFGIIIMINPNKTSIKKKYIQEIIENDPLYVKDTLDDIFPEIGLVNLESKYYIDENKSETIKIYHYILNIYNLVKNG